MAAVWLGHDDVLERPVAIKVLSDTIASDPDFLARFRREATVAAGLSHPNLVDVYDYSESGERPYLVMEFVSGRDLRSLISREEWIDRDRLAVELLGAVAHIHAAGIIHRDIKPHNIVLDDDRTAKLIDFGIALPPDATSLTQTGLVLATKRYAAPEVMAGHPANERSDLYSCGVVLEACGSGGSPALRSLVADLTDEDPGNRPRTASQALSRLDSRAKRGQPTEAFIPTFERRAPGREPAPEPRAGDVPPTRVYSRPASNRKRWLAGTAILGVAAAVAVAVVLAAGSGGSSPVAKRSPGPSGKAKGKPKQESGGAPAEAQAGAAAGAEAGAEGAAPEDEAVVASETPSADVPVPAGNNPAAAEALNQEGFELIQAGSYAEAVPILEESVRAFPAGTEEIGYAYALFNLGDALRLSGNPAAAIAVLEQRLLIPNQTEVVERELEAARSEAG